MIIKRRTITKVYSYKETYTDGQTRRHRKYRRKVEQVNDGYGWSDAKDGKKYPIEFID